MEDERKTQTTPHPAKAKFDLGRVVATPGVRESLTHGDISTGLARHGAGDWGDLDREDWQANEDALADGGRLFSVYHARGSGERFYVITEADRSVTTLLLPDEY